MYIQKSVNERLWAFNVFFFLQKFNELSIKYQSYQKTGKIYAFGQKYALVSPY